MKLPDYQGAVRPLVVQGLGREQPTLFLSNNTNATARDLICRYAQRNRIEDGIGIGVNFFHLDCLASAVRLNVDVDVALTVLANGCYRWLAQRLRGFDKAAPKQLFRRFVETAGQGDRGRPHRGALRPTQPQPGHPRSGTGRRQPARAVARQPNRGLFHSHDCYNVAAKLWGLMHLWKSALKSASYCGAVHNHTPPNCTSCTKSVASAMRRSRVWKGTQVSARRDQDPHGASRPRGSPLDTAN